MAPTSPIITSATRLMPVRRPTAACQKIPSTAPRMAKRKKLMAGQPFHQSVLSRVYRTGCPPGRPLRLGAGAMGVLEAVSDSKEEAQRLKGKLLLRAILGWHTGWGDVKQGRGRAPELVAHANRAGDGCRGEGHTPAKPVQGNGSVDIGRKVARCVVRVEACVQL